MNYTPYRIKILKTILSNHVADYVAIQHLKTQRLWAKQLLMLRPAPDDQ